MRCSLIYSLFMTLILMSSSSSYASYGKVYEISEDEIQDLCGTVGSGYSGWKYFREELAFITEEDDFETDDRKIIDFFLDHKKKGASRLCPKRSQQTFNTNAVLFRNNDWAGLTI